MAYLFEEYVLDAERRELRRGAVAVPMEPQVFDLLVYLVRNREHVVSRDELFASVWRGRIVSESALSTRINAARSALGDSGEAQRFIRTFPRRGVRFVAPVREGQAIDALALSAGGSSDKPSLAILPFDNLGGDQSDDYFTDGIVEDITTALSRNRAFFVIARNSSFTYKGVKVETGQIARELGVRYVLKGSVRKSGGRVRITAQLIEAACGKHLWADRFDRDTAEIFELQDEIVTRVVGAIAPQLEKAEINRAKSAGTRDLPAYDLYLRGLDHWNRWTKEANASALRLFYAAMEKDPDFPTPYGLAASCYLFARANDWDSAFDPNEISRLVDRAAAIGMDDPIALCWAGHVHAYFFRDIDRALLLVDRAIELDVNLAIVWQRSGWIRAYAGDSDGAVDSLNKAMRLNPLDPLVFLTQSAMGFAHFIAGRDDDAADWAAMALRVKPNWLPALRVAIASNAMRGNADEATRALGLYRSIDRKVDIGKICECYPLRRDADRERLIFALRKAGVPE